MTVSSRVLENDMEIELIEFGRKHKANFSADVMMGRMALEETLCPSVLWIISSPSEGKDEE